MENMNNEMIPQHARISKIYRDMIKSGQYTEGQRIDSEFEICDKHGVSRITARRVLMDLEKEGLVSRHRGKGTFCIWKSEIEVQLYPTCDVMDAIQTPDRKVWLKTLSEETIKADDSLALTMGIYEGEELIETKQLQMVDEVKVTYIVSDVLPSQNNRPAKTTTKIRTMLPPSEVQSAMKLYKEQPILLKEIFFYDENNDVKQYDRYYYRGDCVFTSSK